MTTGSTKAKTPATTTSTPEPDGLDARREALLDAIGRAEKRVARRKEAIRGDLARAAEADSVRTRAALLLAYASAVPKGARVAVVRDEDDRELEIELPEGATPVAHAQTLYKKARKLDTTARIAAERLDAADHELAALAALSVHAAAATDEAQLAPAIAGAARLRVVGSAQAKKHAPSPHAPKVRMPYRRFLASGEREIRVGKTARDNDALTLKHSKSRDLFLHARDVPGAHVIVPLGKSETCPTELFLDAATLAAHFSDARSEAVVDVVHARRGHVRKPRGAPPGLVSVDREKVTPLRIEPTRLARLLAAEVLD